MSKGISLHLGMNAVDPAHYGGWSGELLACEADANDMASSQVRLTLDRALSCSQNRQHAPL